MMMQELRSKDLSPSISIYPYATRGLISRPWPVFLLRLDFRLDVGAGAAGPPSGSAGGPEEDLPLTLASR